MRSLVFASMITLSCVGPTGPAGQDGTNGEDGTDPTDPGGTPSSSTDTPIKLTSGARIKARTKTVTQSTADGAKFVSTTFAGWFDAMRNEPCFAQPTGDGELRCLPRAVDIVYDSYFSDPACTQPVAIESVSTSSCPDATPVEDAKYISEQGEGSCSGSIGKLWPATRLQQTQYYRDTFTGCFGESPTSGWRYYAISGAEIPLTAFAVIESTTTE